MEGVVQHHHLNIAPRYASTADANEMQPTLRLSTLSLQTREAPYYTQTNGHILVFVQPAESDMLMSTHFAYSGASAEREPYRRLQGRHVACHTRLAPRFEAASREATAR